LAGELSIPLPWGQISRHLSPILCRSIIAASGSGVNRPYAKTVVSGQPPTLTKHRTPAILSLEVDVDTQPGQDAKILREKEYADDTHLDIRRRTHQLYTVKPVDFCQWTLERLPWRGDEWVLDVGCGPGDLLCEMAHYRDGWGLLVGSDFSAGMIIKAVRLAADLPIHFCVSDAQAIPFPDSTFDVVMARHMLYHVPDIDQAVAEAARVLRPGGYFLTTTNSAHTMPEYKALRDKAAARFPTLSLAERITDRYALENADSFLKPHFDRLEMHTLPGTLRFPIAQPFVDYFASARTLIMRPDHSDAEWQTVLNFVQTETEETIARQGHFDVTKITGAIVGVKGS
jgi:ubiquinone/menaquinone biosynthesis C-methylase UbiE